MHVFCFAWTLIYKERCEETANCLHQVCTYSYLLLRVCTKFLSQIKLKIKEICVVNTTCYYFSYCILKFLLFVCFSFICFGSCLCCVLLLVYTCYMIITFYWFCLLMRIYDIKYFIIKLSLSLRVTVQGNSKIFELNYLCTSYIRYSVYSK